MPEIIPEVLLRLRPVGNNPDSIRYLGLSPLTEGVIKKGESLAAKYDDLG